MHGALPRRSCEPPWTIKLPAHHRRCFCLSCYCCPGFQVLSECGWGRGLTQIRTGVNSFQSPGERFCTFTGSYEVVPVEV